MKPTILIILISLLISSCSGYHSFQPWTDKEKVLEGLYLLSSYIDYQQTNKITRTENARELNPSLGEKPSTQQITEYFVLTRIAHYAVADFLDHDDRLIWLSVTLGASGATIYWNYRMGF